MRLVTTSSATVDHPDIQQEVVDAGLCVLCGACLNRCPYIRKHEGRIVTVNSCSQSEAECYRYCPRTPTDWDFVSQKVFGVPYEVDGIGTTRNVFLCRSNSSQIHNKAQDGGVITTLLSIAMEEGLIDAAVETAMTEEKSPMGFVARSQEEILRCAGNSYEASFSLEALNLIPKENNEKLGIVGVPCQIEALGKMRAYPSQKTINIDNIKIVLGLFCGWALLPHQFHQFLKGKVDLRQTVKFDIPHHPADTFDIYQLSNVQSVKLNDIREFINPACSYCLDMTSEFADISVGSGRRMFGWNTVIIRSERGEELFEMSQARGLLETIPIPETGLDHLKSASLNKKKRAISNIVKKSGDRNNLLYLKGGFTWGQELLSDSIVEV